MPVRTPLLCLLLFALPLAAADTVRREVRTSALLPGTEVVIEQDGSARLAGSVLLADETGATDYRQTESLGPTVRVRKIFALDGGPTGAAELLYFGSARTVQVNGHALPAATRVPSTGWMRIPVSPGLLTRGDNVVELSGGGQLLLEPGRASGRSLKSGDGGKTWSATSLGQNGDQQGEYVVRLRLQRFAPRGWLESDPLDLWDDGSDISAPAKTGELLPPADLPAGASLRFRVGTTPTPDASWSAWQPLTAKAALPAERAGDRWLQLRLELTSDGTTTPRVPPKWTFGWRRTPDAVAGAKVHRIIPLDPPPTRSPVPFVYQKPTPRLKLLRERYRLDEVIAPGKTEMEQLMLLRTWVRNQWHTAWGSHPAQWMPPWDALIILGNKDQPDCLTMCTHYAAVFVQVCLALGWNARHCILDHHCVAEVWVESHRKWVMMDAGNSKERADLGLHFERDGVPLSACELLLAYHRQKLDGIEVCFTPEPLAKKIAPLCRPAPGKPTTHPDRVPLAELPQHPVCQIANYRRYAFPGRNTFLDSPLPGELYQGWSEYFHDGYWWVGESADRPTQSPEYSFHLDPERRGNADWDLNGCRVHLTRTARPDELRVDVESWMPNQKRLEREENGQWKPTPAGFAWKLQPGKNTLRVRALNAWDRQGTPAVVAVESGE